MTRFFYILFFISILGSATLYAGNPDRQGEAGAYELLMNPWAKSAGLHTMTTSNVSGVEALRINVAGLSRIENTEVHLGTASYLRGTDINMNALGVAQRIGKSGAIGFSIMALDLGDIKVTTEDQPEGTGTFYSPSFFNIGVAYAHTFENKVSVGILFRGISQSTADIAAFGFALDAGVQYVTGPQDNFKFGISIRNVGSRMQFSGQGLAEQVDNPNDGSYQITVDQRSAGFELPSLLNIGLSYDFLIGKNHRITPLGNFTANSFSRDQIGGGIEYSLKDLFQLRAGYKTEFDQADVATSPIYDGLSAGASVEFPLSKKNKNIRLGLDYAYRDTRLYDGTHNFSVRILL